MHLPSRDFEKLSKIEDEFGDHLVESPAAVLATAIASQAPPDQVDSVAQVANSARFAFTFARIFAESMWHRIWNDIRAMFKLLVQTSARIEMIFFVPYCRRQRTASRTILCSKNRTKMDC